MRSRQTKIGIALLLSLTWLSVFSARGERYPFKVYTIADGLAHDDVNRIVRDSRGFLWFCTGDGLSRFNGYSFKTYTQEHGLPSRNINGLLETREGEYLIATSGGLAVFDPLGKAFHWNLFENKLDRDTNDPPMFRTFFPPEDPGNRRANTIYDLAQTTSGAVYVGTNHGLFRVEKAGTEWVFHKVESELFQDKTLVYNTLHGDRKGGLWVVANGAVYRIAPDGAISMLNDVGGNYVLEDHDGRIWVDSGGEEVGIRRFVFDGDVPRLEYTFNKQDGLPATSFTRAVAETVDGRIFVVSNGTVGEYQPLATPGEPRFNFADADLADNGAIDSGGNLWFGTEGKGAWKLSLTGFATFGPEAGGPKAPISSLILDDAGTVYLLNEDDLINRLEEGKIESVKPLGFKGRGWGYRFLDFRSSNGEWWIPSIDGLLRYPAVADLRDLSRTAPLKIFTTNDGLFANYVLNIFEDSRRDVWIAASNGTDSLHRWDRATDKIVRYTAADGIPSALGSVTSFGEDAAGNLWFSFYYGGLIRYRRGVFRTFTAAEGIPEGGINNFLSDSKGRFWIATRTRGLFRVNDPDAETPVFHNLSARQGLLSNEATCLAEDKLGRVYIGTGRGLNRLDPDANTFRSYSQADGLPGNYVSHCRADRNGVLWVAGNNSVARFVPGADKPPSAPPVFVDGLSINGVSRRVSELGETKIEGLRLGPEQKQIQINFFALGFDSGDTLRYQYKLNEQDWSSPSDQRTVSLNLSAGTYQFAVRAITADGVPSVTPAVVTFTIARPVWQRWWFVTLVVLVLAGAVFAFVRSRIAKARQLQKAREERIAELQRVRSRIATDLHDDIGSSLTQIAVYSELARQRESENGKAGEPLDMITNVADELVDTMSDIVWAINPTKDHLQDLTQRMRRFAANVLSAKDIDLEFRAPDSENDIPLGANIRREVFLIFKETINNIVKHSAAKTATVEFRLEPQYMTIVLRDDGQGFDPQAAVGQNGQPDWKRFRGGNGLLNMKKRAGDLGGSYTVESAPGSGATVTLMVPFEVQKPGEKIPT